MNKTLQDKFRILIVDDERKICEILKEILEKQGYQVDYALNGSQALTMVEQKAIDLVLLDIKMPDIDGIALLKKIKNINPDLSVVIISAFGTVPLAVEALKSGAEDFVEKPLEANRVLTTVKNTLEKIEYKKQSRSFKDELLKGYRIIGESLAIKKVIQFIDRVALTNSAVLILGETGSGKELVARNIHMKSQRATKPFVKVNCAALPGELIESELFGYEKGAFTGAYTRKPGQFEIANQGTLFLDEIGDMSPVAQAKVLRAIEENEIQHLGSTTPIKIDIRLITATNQNLEELVKLKKFREDFYHRINVLTISVPPLRERREDIPILAEHFLRNFCFENNCALKNLTKKANQFLMRQDWPGNVRELKHFIEKMAVLIENTTIDVDNIKQIIDEDRNIARHTFSEDTDNKIEKAKDDFERNYIINVLDQTGWQIIKAAETLGIDRSTLFRKIKRLGIKK